MCIRDRPWKATTSGLVPSPPPPPPPHSAAGTRTTKLRVAPVATSRAVHSLPEPFPHRAESCPDTYANAAGLLGDADGGAVGRALGLALGRAVGGGGKGATP